MSKKIWLVYALITTVAWGFWGALSGAILQNGFPETMVYCIWAVTMLIPGISILKINKWKIQHDRKSIVFGSLIGFLGAGGQLLLFQALRIGPAYLIFPIISISPVVTIILSFIFLKERTGTFGTIGIVLALLALPLFEYSRGEASNDYGVIWFVLSILVLVAWGVQAYFIKLANKNTDGGSIFFYMTVTAILLIPLALFMTDFSSGIEFGSNEVLITAGIQVLNSIGALFLVFAYRYGKAIVVSPLINAGAPLMTAVISMILISVIPSTTKIIGIVFALVAALLLALEPENEMVEN